LQSAKRKAQSAERVEKKQKTKNKIQIATAERIVLSRKIKLTVAINYKRQ